MSYYNYHAKVKKLILSGLLERYEFVDEYNGIKPALVLYFRDNPLMPIRSHRWEEYLPFLQVIADKRENEKKYNKNT